jgi:hypothetical protein
MVIDAQDRTEAPWRRRFRAARVTFPRWARDEPDRLVYASNGTGKWEVYAWDRRTGSRRQATDRPEGTTFGLLDPLGEHLWWFDDSSGDEFGRWVVEPFSGGPARPAAPALPAAYSAGIGVGRSFALIGSSREEQGASVHLVPADGAMMPLYAHRNHAEVAGLSRDETLFCLSHTEHGDDLHPALRVLDLRGRAVADLWERARPRALGPGVVAGPRRSAPARPARA